MDLKRDVDTGIDAELTEEERKRYDRFRKLRVVQERAARRRLRWTDLAVAAAILFGLKHVATRLNLSLFKTSWRMFILSLLYFLYSGRAPKKAMPWKEYDHPVVPIIGQINQVIGSVTKGLVGNQLERAKLRGYRTTEMVLFGPIQDFALMDVRDREYVLKTNWRNFTKNLTGSVGFQEILAPVMGRGIFTSDPRTEKDGDDEWAEHRKVASHLFSANALRHKMELAFYKHAHHLVDLLKGHSQGQIVDIQEIMQAFTFDAISDIAFGASPGALDAAVLARKKIDFLVRFDRAQNLCLNRLVVPTIVWKALRFLHLGYEAQLSEDAEALRDYVQQIISDRKNEMSSVSELKGDHHGDILSLYMKAARESRKPYLAEDAYLSDVVLNIMVAGRDTTSSTLTQLFRILSGHPEVAEKMMDEMTRVLKGAEWITWDHVKDLPYSAAVFQEVLRLHPPVHGDFRLCNETCTLPSGLVVKKGNRVSMTIAAIGRDFHIWDKPDEFVPERWIDYSDPENPVTKRIPEYLYPCFWGGPRICLGKDAARLEVLSTVYIVLMSGLRFNLLPGQSEKIKIGPVQFYEEGVNVRVACQ